MLVSGLRPAPMWPPIPPGTAQEVRVPQGQCTWVGLDASPGYAPTLVHPSLPTGSAPAFGLLPWRCVPGRPVKQRYWMVPGQFFRRRCWDRTPLSSGKRASAAWQGPGLQPHSRDPGCRLGRLVGAARAAPQPGAQGSGFQAGTKLVLAGPLLRDRPGAAEHRREPSPVGCCRNSGTARLLPPDRSRHGLQRGATASAMRSGSSYCG